MSAASLVKYALERERLPSMARRLRGLGALERVYSWLDRHWGFPTKSPEVACESNTK